MCYIAAFFLSHNSFFFAARNVHNFQHIVEFAAQNVNNLRHNVEFAAQNVHNLESDLKLVPIEM